MNIISRIYLKLKSIIEDNLLPSVTSFNYVGYKMYYSRGTSIVGRITKADPIYELETSEFLAKELQDKKNPVFVDIGANIGFLSLYVKRNVPQVTIYAFEPGPHQQALFSKTIKENNLERTIHLSDVAISDKKGEAKFCVHNTKHVSGDGFNDTGLAGNYTEITVKTITLDDWWLNEKKPAIDLIKIDTEGAELFILRGAKQVLTGCQPVLYFEMYPTLYKAYDYDHNDILGLLDDYNYQVFAPTGKAITKENVDQTLYDFASYIARPRKSITA